MKTARFATVVAKSGRPALHLTWMPLEKDAPLKSALAANRVMTIHQAGRGGHTDFGTIGFTKGPRTQILIFPKSLRRFADQRVVGINYDLLDTTRSFATASLPEKPLAGTARAKKPPGEVVRFPARTDPPPAPKARVAPAQTPPSKPAPEVKPPLTWGEALHELEAIRRHLRGKSPEAAARLTELAERVRERLKPH